jgi:hypothetical protein
MCAFLRTVDEYARLLWVHDSLGLSDAVGSGSEDAWLSSSGLVEFWTCQKITSEILCLRPLIIHFGNKINKLNFVCYDTWLLHGDALDDGCVVQLDGIKRRIGLDVVGRAVG